MSLLIKQHFTKHTNSPESTLSEDEETKKRKLKSTQDLFKQQLAVMQTKLPKQQLKEIPKEIELVIENIPCVAKKKTSTERVRAYRARQKCIRQPNVVYTASLSSAERVRADRVKSSTERVRQYRARKKMFSVVESLALPKCLEVITLAYKYENRTIAEYTNLSVVVVEKILECMEHIQTIFKYVPNAIKFIMPNELDEIKAITEILKEFMCRLMHRNLKLTDEELMLNAKLLTKVFCVNGMQIDEKWTQFFRQNFQQTSSIKKSIKNINETDFYIQNILNDVQDMLNSKVVIRFKKYLNKNSNHLILIYTVTEQETVTDTLEEPQKLSIKEEIEIGEYIISETTSEMLCEPQEFRKHEENEPDEFISNDELIEIYAVIDDEDDDDGNLMDYDEQTVTSLASADESTTKMDEHSFIKQEIENSEYIASEADVFKYSQELLIDQIKAEPIEICSNQNIKNETKVLFVKSQAVQPSTTPISMELKIKQEPSEPNSVNSDNNEICIEQAVLHTKEQMCVEPIEHIAKLEPIETLKTEVNQSIQNKEHKIKQEPIETDANDESMPPNKLMHIKYGDHLTEERALHIGRIFNLKPYGKLNCELLLLDPIICTYMHILSDQPPLFSEAALRKSFQIVLGEELYNCQYHYYIQPKDLVLYRRFVLLFYSTKYKLPQLKDVMKNIFSEFEVKIIVANSHHILEEWRTFFNKHFISTLYTKAVYEILFEYRTRHCLISTVLDQNVINALPETTIKDIQQFLHSNFKLEQYWQHGYEEYIKKKVNKMPNDCSTVYTINDLSLNCIYEDIKELLPQLVVETVNSDNSERSAAIDRYNKN